MSENNTNNNQVRFLTGTQENLNNMSTSQVGTFYLTSDTNRLYVGAQEGGPVLLNKAVAVVQNIGQLPTEGIDLDSFYYLKDENILCVYAKQGENTTPEWIQINHQAITTNVVNDALTFTLDETNEEDSLKYNVTLTQQTYNPATGECTPFTTVTPATGVLEIDASALAGLVPDAASVGLIATEEDDGIVIKTSGEGSNAEENISIVSDGLAEVSIDTDNNIKISTTSIGLKAVNDPNDLDGDGIINSLTLTLESTDSNGATETLGETLVIKSGPDAEFKANFIDRKNTLQIQHAVMNTDASVSASDGNYIKGITLKNGHVTGIEQEALPEDNDTTITSGTLDTDYTLVLTDSNGKSEVEIDLSQIYTDAVDASTEMFNVVNQALLYQGVVSTAQDLQAKPITNGHMYKIGADFSITSGEGEEQTTTSYSTGDLIIAYENKWEIVPSGDEVDTTYEGVVTTGDTSIEYHIKDRNAGTPGDALTLNFGTGLAFNKTTKTVSHADKTITPTTGTSELKHGGSFTIPIISKDSQGHIDSIVNQTFKLPTETNYSLFSLDNKTYLVDSANGDHGSLELASRNNNLNIVSLIDASYENVVYTFDLQWESFDPVTPTT